MTIRFTCPGCKTRHELADDMAGKTIVCPCGAKLKLPAAGSSKNTAGSASPARPAGQPHGPAPGYSAGPPAYGNGGYTDGPGYAPGPGYTPASGYGPGPGYPPGPVPPGGYPAPGGYSAPGYGPPMMGGYPGGPNSPLGYPPGPMPYGAAPYAATPPRRRFRLSLELVAVIAVVVVGLGIWLTISVARSKTTDEAKLADVDARLRAAQAEMERQDRENRRREAQRRANSTGGTGSTTSSGSGRTSPTVNRGSSQSSGATTQPSGRVIYTEGTGSASATGSQALIPLIQNFTSNAIDPDALGEQAWIGNVSLCPPRVLKEVRNELSTVDGVTYGRRVYASGPGITESADIPQSSLEITIGRALTPNPVPALESAIANLRSTSGLRQFQWPGRAGIRYTSSHEGVRFTCAYFIGRNAQDKPVTGAAYVNIAQRPGINILTMFTIMSEGDGDSVHFRELKAAVGTVGYGRWVGDQELTWIDIDGKPRHYENGKLWSGFTRNRLDLSPQPQYANKLGPEERFGQFVMRRPLGMTRQRYIISTPWFGWTLTHRAQAGGDFDFYVCVTAVGPNIHVAGKLWKTIYGQSKLSFIEPDDTFHWNQNASGIAEQNGLTCYRLVGRVSNLPRKKHRRVLCQAAVHNEQMIIIVGYLPESIETNQAFELMGAATRTLRPLGAGEEVATPIALVDDDSDRVQLRSLPRPRPTTGLPDWTLPKSDPAASLGETRFGLFAMRLPPGYEQIPIRPYGHKCNWYFAKNGPSDRQYILKISIEGTAFNTLLISSGNDSLKLPDNHRLQWDDQAAVDCKLSGLAARRLSGGVYSLSRSTEKIAPAQAVVTWHDGQQILVTAYALGAGATDESELEAMLTAMRTLRPLTPQDKVSTVPTSYEVYLRQQTGIH